MLFPALVNFQLHLMTHTSLFRSLCCDQETRIFSQPQKREHLLQCSLVGRRLKPSYIHITSFQCLPAAAGGECLPTGSTFGGGFGMSSSGELREDIE